MKRRGQGYAEYTVRPRDKLTGRGRPSRGQWSEAMTRWGIIGCGDVTEVKSGPGFQNADGSALVAVMRRDRAKAQDANAPAP